jgi:epoxyqueuosine reductase
LERDLAYRAGLGWVGKNTCLIHPEKGSLFFIGQVLTSLPLVSKSQPVHDFCGTCDRCLRACPTQAFEAPRVLNATKCIAYWTIEARTAAPNSLRERFGDWFFGCDICQTVCPWNEKVFGKNLMAQLTLRQEPDPCDDLRWILRASRKELARAFKNSPLSRARPAGLKRNALYVIGNLALHSLRPEVETCLAYPDLKEVAEWTLGRLA